MSESVQSKASKLKLSQILIIAILFIAWFLIGYQIRDMLIPQDDKLVSDAKQIIEKNFYETPPSSQELAYAAIRGMLYSLGDVRATFYEPQSALAYVEYGRGRHGKIGIATEMSGTGLLVKEVEKNLPADLKGIKPGDTITRIDGWEVKKNTTHSEAGSRIVGDPGTDVTLTIMRNGRSQEYTLTRIEVKAVTSSLIDGNIGYIRQTVFSEDSMTAMRSALLGLLDKTPRGIIWDLRGNPGGSGEAAYTIINYFVRQGTIFSQSSREGKLVHYNALPEKCIMPEGLRLAVLVDHESTSSAEVSAAAIQELGRGIVLGEKTYGKGTVNYLYPLADGSLIEMTTRKWLSPLGNNYHKTGIAPDIQITDDPKTTQDEVLEKASAWLLGGSQ